MGGNMKVWIVVATWFWWNAVVGPTWSCPLEQHTLSGSCPVEQQYTLSRSCPSMVAEQHTLNYQTVTFTTKVATKSSYTQFIEALRAQLAGGEKPRGIPVTREPSTVRDSQRFVLVELSNRAAHSITLAVDVTNAYVVAYRTGSKYFLLKEDNHDPAIVNPFPKIKRDTFRFNGSYPGLEKLAEKDRENISLGMNPLENAISALWSSNLNQKRALARSLIVVIQMVAEAARFTYIESQVRKRVPRAEEVFFPTPTMLKYENKWGALSRAIQQSNQGGVFLNPVQLIDTNKKHMKVDNTKHPAVKGLAIMLFSCKSKSDRAAYPEPTMLISSRNGLCVEVKDYRNGNSIELRPCKETLEVNQLWTLRKDGTIRSNGMCLTTNGSSPGSQVMIYDCPTRVTAATIWQLWENGTITNHQSGLVLSAESGNSGTTLRVQSNIHASRQGWLASNNTEPFVTSIVGFNDLCMQAYVDAMWVEECASGNANQKWAVYPDGSIRPQQNQDHCLTISSDKNSQEIIILISSCSHGSEDQRWVFKKEGSIWNLARGMVMEVKKSDPSLHQIILSGFTGNPNQKWLPLF